MEREDPEGQSRHLASQIVSLHENLSRVLLVPSPVAEVLEDTLLPIGSNVHSKTLLQKEDRQQAQLVDPLLKFVQLGSLVYLIPYSSSGFTFTRCFF